MSAFPGKVRVLGVLTPLDVIGQHVYETLRHRVGFELLGDPNQKLLLCDFIQARNPEWVNRPFLAEFDEGAAWFDDLRPALGQKHFPFDIDGVSGTGRPLASVTELLHN